MFRIAIDRGGTFTDVFAVCPNNRIVTLKLLSQNPDHYADAPFEAIRQILLQESLADNKKDRVDFDRLTSIRMGTTVGTNALLEHKGERVAVVLSKGFRDIFRIGFQNREKIFELNLEEPFCLYEKVVEVDERIILYQEQCDLYRNVPIETASTGEKIAILKPICHDDVYRELKSIYDQGIRCLAIAFVHSYLYPKHELIVEEIAKKIGFVYITLSSRIMPMIRYVPRGMTSITDVYLTSHIKDYINGFLANFLEILIVKSFSGGVIGYAMTTVNDIGLDRPIIGFDMGGTSTDVSRYHGRFEHKFESKIADVIIQTPQLDIHTVAAGGGSRLYFMNGLFVVGPESSGSYPGPICYRNNGYLSVTDANLCLDQELDYQAVVEEFEKLAVKINDFYRQENRKEMTVQEIALGFIKVANETMCRPIRKITQGKGYEISNHVLTCFGGAGGQHACAIARSLGISKVFIHKYAGILSAYGIALADVVHEETTPCSLIYRKSNLAEINSRINHLCTICENMLLSKGFHSDSIRYEIFLNLRYDRTDFALMITCPSDDKRIIECNENNFLRCFYDQYQREFGFLVHDRDVWIDDIRVRSIGFIRETFLPAEDDGHDPEPLCPIKTTNCYFENIGFVSTPIYDYGDLRHNHSIQGPAILIETNCTILIEPNCVANVTKQRNILIEIETEKSIKLSPELDPIYLSLFSHIFMGIAEQMGSILQHTAISTNIKERLDFSCAIFNSKGHLVSNAPHIPVHLGSMGKVVQYLAENNNEMNPGDVFLTNHPSEGGTHLPDLTVVTPVFYQHSKPIFFVASRGHHADIGGLTPGSMPSNSISLNQEGATFQSFKLVKENVFQEDQLIAALMKPEQHPGCSGTRALNDNLSDLKAQIAANNKGSKLVNELIEMYGLNVVAAYMDHIQKNAELEVKDLMKRVVLDHKTNVLQAYDHMDDGSILKLKIVIDPKNGNCLFDFTGTGEQVHGNWNAPESITYSAIIYCLRCMIGHDIPLNHGLLSSIKVIFPKNSIISPSEDAAVVGGNVLTSQRITDVIFKAFGVCAASQGCMNNITFGNSTISYYETVAGGAGATKNSDGRSGVHTHMTNTRITDVEILEKRYPVIVKTFRINSGTGGRGHRNGGDGLIRELLFRQNLTLSVLTERRVFSPYGMNGGNEGRKGKNLIKKKNGVWVNLGSRNTIDVSSGDLFRLETPGGGGFGPIE
ncbi:5-oxoprolinase [Sarcoptes scabiei]|uniref:5-oxoprolinase n=1 Tax=Sarcoptes scabiei TaxID=52283 RepID=A0A834VC10_SARSC|nr:5-oxoprolinase [Sarcoptes scabiei]